MSAPVMDALFEGRSVPRWLRAFERDPDEAVDALLLGRADLGHLNAAEPTVLLLDWLRVLGSEFEAACDAALTRWIARAWGRPLPAAGSASLVSLAWVAACELIAGSPGLTRAAAALRERVLFERHVLAALVEGRARDPEGRAWLALARHQPDRALLDEWWRLCRLPPDEPWYRGLYGIHGLEGLPRERPDKGGGFPVQVAEGLRVLALALLERESEGWLRPGDGERELVPLARLTLAAHPFPAKWRAFWAQVLGREEVRGGSLRAWLRKVDAGLVAREGRGTSPRGVRSVRDPRWVARGQAIRTELHSASGAALEAVLQRAKALLLETEHYARATGDTYSVVRGAASFAAALRHTRPALALEWAGLAREFEPWNAYAWNTSAACALALGQRGEALGFALEATRRFPDDAVARNGLAEVLKAQGDLDQAEAVYREATRRFPDNAVARNGLAEVLKAQGHLDQAEAVYREATRRFPDNAVARNGLAQLLRERGRFDEARPLYQEVLDHAPDATSREIARQGLDAIQRRSPSDTVAGGASAPRPSRVSGWPAVMHDAPATPDDDLAPAPTSDAQAVAQQTTAAETPPAAALRPDDVPRLLSDAYLLRRFGLALGTDASPSTATGRLRQRARGVLVALQPRLERDARAAGAAALTELTLGDLHEAQALLREAARRFPGSARVRYARARLERELVRRDGADPAQAQAAWQGLERLDPRFRPVALLGAGRTWLGLPGAPAAEARARESFGQLGYWLAQRTHTAPDAAEHAARPFVAWWSDELRTRVFAGLDVRRADDLPDLAPLRANLACDPLAVDHLEDDFVERFAFV